VACAQAGKGQNSVSKISSPVASCRKPIRQYRLQLIFAVNFKPENHGTHWRELTPHPTIPGSFLASSGLTRGDRATAF